MSFAITKRRMSKVSGKTKLILGKAEWCVHYFKHVQVANAILILPIRGFFNGSKIAIDHSDSVHAFKPSYFCLEAQFRNLKHLAVAAVFTDSNHVCSRRFRTHLQERFAAKHCRKDLYMHGKILHYPICSVAGMQTNL